MNVSRSARFRSAGQLRTPVFLAIGIATLVAAGVLGVADISPGEVFDTMSGRGSDTASLILLDLRLPRIATGILAGIHFALAGAILQMVTRNPLADPTILGISQGATLAVTVFLFFAVYLVHNDSHTLYQLPVRWLPAIGSLGGMAAAFFIFFMTSWWRMSAMRLTLCGIAVGAVLQALAMGIIAGWGSSRLEIVMLWLSGSLYARGWDHALFLLPFSLAGSIALFCLNRPLQILRFSPESAASFGLAYRLNFAVALLTAGGLAASAVGVTGPLLFVGLVVPHMARFVARGTAGTLALSALFGAILVTAADLTGRLAGAPEEIPVGVMTSLFGAPVLFFLLRRMK